MSKPKQGDLSVQRSITFNPNIDYELILAKLSEDFNKKWEKSVPSPETGLEGYEEKATLGSGSFGRVILVKEKETGEYHAVKILVKSQVVKTKQVNHVHQEKKVLDCMHFPFMIRLHFSRKDNDCVYLGLPFVNGGELFSYQRKVHKFSEKEARFYASQIILAIEYLHNVKILYRDLKPENILICANGYVKITDFGFAKKVESRTMTLCGTPEYLPPEVIQSKPYGTSVDYWSFGILVYEFVAGNSPFAQYAREIMVMYSKICDGEYKMPAFFSAHLRDLIDRLLQVDLTKRFGNLTNGIKDIKEHVWFQTIDWMALLNQQLQPPYVPAIASREDISHFDRAPDAKPFLKSKTNRHAEEFEDF